MLFSLILITVIILFLCNFVISPSGCEDTNLCKDRIVSNEIKLYGLKFL